jgi:putative methyltransferase
MTNMTALKILISVPSFWQNYYSLPTIFYLLKNFCDLNLNLANRLEWLMPIATRGTADELFEPYSKQTVDVLGLSCYEWNWELQLMLAKKFKEQQPHVLIVGGGPQIDYKCPDFFENHPYIDIIVTHEGEMPFAEILERRLSGSSDFSGIQGTLWRGTQPQSKLPTPFLQQDFESSPFIEQEEHIRRLLDRQANGKKKMAIWETNRGCPYGCTFCDWGSATMSKLRCFPKDRLLREIDFFSRNAFDVLFIADANFGILERDVELAKALAHAKEKTGYPKFIIYLTAKINGERNLEIADIFHQARMTSSIVLSLQHTDRTVLNAIKRTNMPQKKLLEHLKGLEEKNIPFMPQLIIGSPGDTYEKWTTCLSDLMDMGMHEEIRSQNFSLLANSPANEPAYLQEWQIETIRRFTICGTERRKKIEREAELTRSVYIVQTKSYSKYDWVEMHMFDTLIKSLHSSGITRLLAAYLKYAIGISYSAFYQLLKDQLFCAANSKWHKAYTHLQNHRLNFLTNPDSTEELAIESLPDSEYLYTTEEWLTYFIADNLDEFFAEAVTALKAAAPLNIAPILDDLVSFQRAVFIDSGYDRRHGRRVKINYDWPSFFREALKVDPGILTLNRFNSTTELIFNDDAVGLNKELPLNWIEANPQCERLQKINWFHTIMGPVHLRSKRTLLEFTRGAFGTS